MTRILESVLTADFKYAWLGKQYRAAVTAAQTLLARLESQADSAVTALSASGSIKSTAGNGKSVEFFGPGDTGLSPTELGSLTGEMLRLYTMSRSALVTSGVAVPTDLEVYNEMLSRLDPVTELGPSTFTTLREVAVGMA